MPVKDKNNERIWKKLLFYDSRADEPEDVVFFIFATQFGHTKPRTCHL
jgi:hypothetical protein